MGEVVTKPGLQLALDNLALRLTIRLGSITVAAISVGIAVLAVILKSS